LGGKFKGRRERGEKLGTKNKKTGRGKRESIYEQGGGNCTIPLYYIEKSILGERDFDKLIAGGGKSVGGIVLGIKQN